jgi:prepilin-type N-terminal cleavage/methylation domain-containing protein
MDKSIRAFTLLEIIVVMVIIGILATLGLMSFQGPREQAAEREAQANLKLISSAEKVFRMEIGQYIPCNNTSEINNNLKLMVPTSDLDGRYKVITNPGNTTFQANARRTSGQFSTGSDIHVFCINETQDSYNNTSCAAAWN